MVDYLYDGTFEGLLTCIHAHYYGERASGIFAAEGYQSSILDRAIPVRTDADKAQAVYDGIGSKLHDEALEQIYRVYLSSHPDKANIIFRYIRLGFRMGASISSLHAHPVVQAFQETDRRVALERHRLLGLLRFAEIAGVLYAKVEPDHDVIELLAGHFAARYRNERFIIFDKRRGKAAFGEQGRWWTGSFDPDGNPDFERGEAYYQRLWKTYFDHIAIRERINPRCQRNFMPARYWKNLVELDTITMDRKK